MIIKKDTTSQRSSSSSRRTLQGAPSMPSKAMSDNSMRSENLDSYCPPSSSIQPSMVRASSTAPSLHSTLAEGRSWPLSTKKIGSGSKVISRDSFRSIDQASHATAFEDPEAQVEDVPVLHPFFDYLARPLNQLHEPCVEYRGLPLQALVDYNASQDDEIQIDEGSMVIVHFVFRDGWASGANLSTGATGAFPVDCLDLGPLNYLMAGSAPGNRFESNMASRQLPRTASRSIRTGIASRRVLSKASSPLPSASSGRTMMNGDSDVRGHNIGSRFRKDEESLALPPSGYSGLSRYRSTATPLIPSEIVALDSNAAWKVSTDSSMLSGRYENF
ncbi:hypothetical protein M427DRAFT_435160 [Gonapodya prolifera JEL478]|uniref:SH3 domain-containing protein n=1 Tax=Gonapodya prolifera (strain JEL478) TaxID=1344416 RepID=A0A139A4V9_GONPJ|nr:hypothetical protein M427DRAFT_435160 [Gonapodya prolifera JEL478]|eukprot:KXS11535.1 hypothetical protein M427DRAFT_435160 [Gonapodya prolifera JEL478]